MRDYCLGRLFQKLRRPNAHAGVVDEDVNPAVPVDDRFHTSVNLLPVSDIDILIASLDIGRNHCNAIVG
jgi:hypothetical protein